MPSQKLEGTLWKWTNYWNGWQPRWFTLEKGMLSYFKSQEEVSLGCKGSINIAAAVVTAHPNDPYRLDVVVPGEQHFYLKAGSPHERQNWLVALGSVKSSVNSERASKVLDDASRLTQKQCEIRLYCDLLMQQIHSVKCLVVDNPVPDVKKLDDCSALLSQTCDTFIHTLEDCVRLSTSNAPMILSGLSSVHSSISGPNSNGTAENHRQISPNSCSKSFKDANSQAFTSFPNIPTFFTHLNSSFSNLKLNADESINTIQFLDCSTDLAKIFDLLNANAFQPIKMDMISNIRKLYQKYESLRDMDKNCDTLQKMIETEIQNNTNSDPNSATKALLELKRVVWFLREFLQMFINFFNDDQSILSDMINKAYEKTLKSNHTWILRGVFTLAAKETVSRDDFYKALLPGVAPENLDDNFLQLKFDIIDFIGGIDRTLKSIDNFYIKQKLDCL